MSESFVAEEVDRLIGSASLRIEQQRIHILESAASPHQEVSANAVLARMIEVLEKLKHYRSQFA